MALAVIAAIGLAVALSGGSSDGTSANADDATAPASASIPATPPAETSRTSTTPKPKPALKTFTAPGANGQSYSCSFAVRDGVESARKRIGPREHVLKGQEAAINNLDRRYPGKSAPEAVARSYNALLARYRTQLAWTNKAIRGYNRKLEQSCDPD
jgi:hypothetical protein